FALTVTVYADTALYDSFRTSNPYYIPGVFNELGFPYCFCHQFTTFSIDRPDGFSRAEAEAWETGDAQGLGKNVHVIMVMDEAFSDLTDDPAFAYTEENDPLPNLHALRADAHAISGRLVAPGFAGGTANTEFDVLTGMQTNAISKTTTSAMRTVNRKLDSLFRVFRRDGYRTSFFHPGDDWFYNRENVYRWLGAETTVFADEMADAEYKGRWVTDAYMARRIEREFEEAAQAGQFLFHFTTTIQNHMSYTADKYGANYVFPPAETAVEVPDEVRTILSVYIEGARDADAMLGGLRDYFAGRSEPVMLVFWGDHLPYLGDNRLAYRALGMDAGRPDEEAENPLVSYEVPYVIWVNDAAAETLDWENAAAALGLREGGPLSAAFLGSAVLELTGRRGESAWFDFLMDLRRNAPVVHKQYLTLADGETRTRDAADEDTAAALAKWSRWSYYKLRYKSISD
ncbi:MAG: LTA synthase family protein, partial [Oscillibacter sp.]|nr:LTA synthase family protein [Oscillibacter sp.]